MNQYWINVLSSAHKVSGAISVCLGIAVLVSLIDSTLCYYGKYIKIPYKYILINIGIFVLFSLLYIFTSPIN